MAATFETLNACDLDTEDLKAALLAGAEGTHVSVRAATQLIVEHGTWLEEDEFLFAIRVLRVGEAEVAYIDWGRIDLDDWHDQGAYQILLMALYLAGVQHNWCLENIFRNLNDHETLLACRAWARVCAESQP
ncbi:MAG: hypothetical protein JO337_04325 [Acidimicrobiales bacterium]|nr:hypothetical protein [Acidimicrobiales bacterium]